jgi:hypothetical protein
MDAGPGIFYRDAAGYESKAMVIRSPLHDETGRFI